MGTELLIDKTAVAKACENRGVATLKLFGSATGQNFNPASSDFDFLVTFLPGRARPFKDYIGLLRDLNEITGRSVDLVDETAIRNPYFKQSALATAKELYVVKN